MKHGIYVKDTKQYSELIAELYENYKEITLPPEYAYFVQENLLQMLIRLSRYKFAARMVRPYDEVLEIGSGSGLGAIFLGQHCRSVKGIEVKEHEVKEASSVNRRTNVSFERGDFFEYPVDAKYDVALALDVIEHMPEETGQQLVSKTTRHLRSHGMLILGTPSCYSYDYSSEFSQAAHVKMYNQQELIELVERYYGRVIAFSMNDELVHTGFPKLAWYYFILAFSPKR